MFGLLTEDSKYLCIKATWQQKRYSHEHINMESRFLTHSIPASSFHPLSDCPHLKRSTVSKVILLSWGSLHSMISQCRVTKTHGMAKTFIITNPASHLPPPNLVLFASLSLLLIPRVTLNNISACRFLSHNLPPGKPNPLHTKVYNLPPVKRKLFT